jgi:hypothetical protein
MRNNQRMADMADEVLARDRARRTEGSFEVVLKTEAGQQLGKPRYGSHGGERADRWQEGLSRERAEERRGERGGGR